MRSSKSLLIPPLAKPRSSNLQLTDCPDHQQPQKRTFALRRLSTFRLLLLLVIRARIFDRVVALFRAHGVIRRLCRLPFAGPLLTWCPGGFLFLHYILNFRRRIFGGSLPFGRRRDFRTLILRRSVAVMWLGHTFRGGFVLKPTKRGPRMFISAINYAISLQSKAAGHLRLA